MPLVVLLSVTVRVTLRAVPPVGVKVVFRLTRIDPLRRAELAAEVSLQVIR
jgi:hypothetical protein